MKSTQYSEKTLDHFRNPRNVGTLEGANVAVGRVGNPVCGDLMDIYIRVEDDRIADISFQTFGCGSAVATSSMVTELVRGMTLDEALRVTRADVADALDGLPPVKMHCSNLAADALHEAIKNWREGLAPAEIVAAAPDTHVACAPKGTAANLGDYVGKGVYTSVPEPAALADARVIVVDKGEASARLALELTRHTGRVVFMTPSKDLDLPPDLTSELKRSDVKLLRQTEPLEARGEDELEKVLVHDLDEDDEYELAADALVVLE
jgi:FeS cluster assembly scaffold protein NifU